MSNKSYMCQWIFKIEKTRSKQYIPLASGPVEPLALIQILCASCGPIGRHPETGHERTLLLFILSFHVLMK